MRKLESLPGQLNLTIEYLSLTAVTPDPDNARRHPTKQIVKLANSIREFGFTVPVIIDEANKLIAGHGRLEAAQYLGLAAVPCVRVEHLSPPQKKALALADNKIGDLSDFDGVKLKAVLLELTGVDFNTELTGFDTGEIDFCIDGASSVAAGDAADTFDEPDDSQPAISRPGDLWQLGDHKLLCGNALESASYEALLGSARAQMAFTDVPYNVPIKGHVSGLGRRTHREFAMASGEMSDGDFRTFLSKAMRLMADHSDDGSIHYQCMDWRGLRTLLEAGDDIYTVKGICVWNKTNAGMGSLYRSQHEFVVVFKNGTAPHQNNVQLGKYGRHRSNVWTYPGANTFSATRDKDLAAHPTVKPVALVADAIRDCSKRGAIILDPFMGSGTTILAAERTGRRAAGIEIDPLYVDTAIRRWQTMTKKPAVLTADGRSFGEVEAERTSAGSTERKGEAA